MFACEKNFNYAQQRQGKLPLYKLCELSDFTLTVDVFITT